MRVKTRSKKIGIQKLSENHYVVMVSEEPKEGMVNDAVLEVLVKYFNVKKSKIILESGEKSNAKEYIIEH